MLVKVSDTVVLNMIGIYSVVLRPVEVSKQIGKSFFSEGHKLTHTEYNVEVNYRNTDGNKDQFTMKCGENFGLANQIYKEVLAQVKEIENVGATQALEEAIKNA